MKKAHTSTYARHTLQISTWHQGTWERFGFWLSSELERERPNGQKPKPKEEIRISAFIRGPVWRAWHTHTYSSCTWPPCDLPNFSAFKNAVKKAILPLEFIRVCVCVRIPLRLSPPSLDKNYIIAVCDLIFLKEHFEVSSFALFVSFPTFFFKVKMTHIKSLSAPCYAMLQHISSLSNVRGKSQF